MIEIVDVSWRVRGGFQWTRILDDVSIRQTDGVVGLLGPNGAGKTTLLRLCATVLPMQSGTIRLRDSELAPGAPGDEVRSFRRGVGYLPQDFPVLPQYTAMEYLQYLGWLAGCDGGELLRRCEAALADVNLSSCRDRKIKTLSGGMCRRLGIAQSLVADPDVILLDEPTTGLDPQERRRFRALIGDLAQKKTVVLSTHLVEDVVRTADTVVVLDRGRVGFQGSLEDLAGHAYPTVSQVEDGYGAIVEAA